MAGRNHSPRLSGARLPLPGVRTLLLAALVLMALLLIAFAALATDEAAGGAQAEAAGVSKDVQTGHYHGGGFPSTPVDFGVSADRRRIKNFKTRAKLDCKSGGFVVATFVFRKIVFRKMGQLIAPDRARGAIRARVVLPNGIKCKQFFGPTGWTARYVG